MSRSRFVVRVRQPDGTWKHDGELLSKKEATHAAAFVRAIYGMAATLWPEKELDKIAHEGPEGGAA